FHVLKDDHQSQPPGLKGGLSGGWIQSDKVLILVQAAQAITQPHDQGSLRIDFPGQLRCFGWDRSNRVWIHRHGFSPCSGFHSFAPIILLFFSFASRIHKELKMMETRKVKVSAQLVPQSEPYIDLENMREIVGFLCCSNLQTVDGSEMLAKSFLGQTIQYNGHTYTITEYIQNAERPEFLCAAARPITFEPFF